MDMEKLINQGEKCTIHSDSLDEPKFSTKYSLSKILGDRCSDDIIISNMIENLAWSIKLKPKICRLHPIHKTLKQDFSFAKLPQKQIDLKMLFQHSQRIKNNSTIWKRQSPAPSYPSSIRDAHCHLNDQKVRKWQSGKFLTPYLERDFVSFKCSFCFSSCSLMILRPFFLLSMGLWNLRNSAIL